MTHTKDEALKLALEAHQAMREWIDAVPDNTVLPAMPGCDRDWLDTVEAAIKQALAAQHEPENEPYVSLASVQEPVAYRSLLASGSYTYCNTPQFFDNAQALYTTPPAQPAPVQESVAGVVLRDGYPTLVQDKHIKENDKRLYTTPPAAQPAIVLQQAYRTSDAYTIGFKDGQAAQPAPVQPVAWIEHHKGGDNLEWHNPGGKCTALYTTPPAAHDLQAELDATNRQVEILSDALAESQRQRQWVGLTPTERKQIEKRYVFVEDAIRLTEAKLKEKNT